MKGAACPILVPMLNARSETAIRVLIAIEPRAYSQTIGYTVMALRPRYAVEVLDPDLLGAEVESRPPDLVLSSLPRPVASGGGPTWVQFRPYAQPSEQLSIDDRHLSLESVEFDDLLSILDEAESLRRCA